MNTKPIYGYVAVQPSKPDICKAGSGFDPLQRVKAGLAWLDERYVVLATFLISSREVESEWKRLLAQYRVGSASTERFRTGPMLAYVEERMAAFRVQQDFKLPQTGFGEPISIAPVELGEVETAIALPITRADSVRPHSTVEAIPPKNPYSLVGKKDYKNV